MAKKKREQRREKRDSGKRIRKKVSLLDQESIKWVDYKDVDLLKRFMSDRAKIRARRVTGNDTQQQKAVARAIKLARELALLPYTQRVATSARGKRRRRDDDDDGDDRSERGERRDRRDRDEPDAGFRSDPVSSDGPAGDGDETAGRTDGTPGVSDGTTEVGDQADVEATDAADATGDGGEEE